MLRFVASSLPRKLAVAVPALLAGLVAASAAQAHTGVDPVHDLSHGFLHPLVGLDHLLAMVAVGVFAAAKGGRALWLVPGSFVVTMVAGGVAGMAGLVPPMVELGIVGSLVVLGGAIFFADRIPPRIGMALVAAMAIFHGTAHGAEIGGASAVPYVIGFVAATALLHAAGAGAAMLKMQSAAALRSHAMRAAGVAFGVFGLALFAL